MTQPVLREATPTDLPRVLELVQGLARYEREPDAVTATVADFERALFPDSGRETAYCLVAEVDGTVVGLAVWFVSFSTWTGRGGIWLEDLYVDPAHRGAGLGAAMLSELAATAVARGYTRVEWCVLDWNEPAICFYQGLGASRLDEWTTWRLDGDSLRAVAEAGATGREQPRGSE